MGRGGYRPGAGRKKGSTRYPHRDKRFIRWCTAFEFELLTEFLEKIRKDMRGEK